MLGREILRVLREAERNGEEVRPEVMAKYTAEVKAITAEIRRRKREEREAQGIDKPPDNSIGLKAAKLGAKGR